MHVVHSVQQDFCVVQRDDADDSTPNRVLVLYFDALSLTCLGLGCSSQWSIDGFL